MKEESSAQDLGVAPLAEKISVDQNRHINGNTLDKFADDIPNIEFRDVQTILNMFRAHNLAIYLGIRCGRARKVALNKWFLEFYEEPNVPEAE